MAEQLEEILSRLLVPDSNVIKQATQQLRELCKDPGIVPALCSVIGASSSAEVRQYAAVLLRRKISKSKQWQALPENTRQNIRQNVLQVLLQAPTKSVQKAIAQVAAVVASHDLPQGHWPELFQFIQHYTQSEQSEHREIGMFVLSTVASSSPECLNPFLAQLLDMFSTTLDDRQSSLVPFYSIQSITSLLILIGSDEVAQIQRLIPKVIAVVRALAVNDVEHACEAFELFDDLAECEVAILVPHIKSLVEFCLEIAANANLDSTVRVKAMSFIMCLVRMKKKAIQKHKLVRPILDVIFPIMCQPPAEGEADPDEEDFGGTEAESPHSVAAQTIDTMALHLPAEKLITQLMQYVQPALGHSDPFYRRAAYVAVAVTSEGCADHLSNKYLKVLLECVCRGINDSEAVVRNAALFALGQFSEYLQPDISKYASELLPLLFDYLGKASQDSERDPQAITRTYYALEMFCENLGKDILPYLPPLMEHLLTALSTQTSIRTKTLAISALGATANAAREEIVPYFPQIIEQLKVFLSPSEDETMLKLQLCAIDTLGVLARTSGKNFMPLAPECVQLSLNLVQTSTDPDLRRCVYGLFAALSTLLKEEMAPSLPTMVKQMLEAANSVEGITAHYENEENSILQVFDEEDLGNDDSDEEEETGNVKSFSVENAYLEEKEDACSALGELAENTGNAFMPYMEEVFTAMMNLCDYPASNIKTSAGKAVTQFATAMHKVAETSPEKKNALHSMLTQIVPKLNEIVRTDEDRQVAMLILEALNEMMKNIGQPVLQQPEHLEIFTSTVKMVLQLKTTCQDRDDEDPDADDEQAEYDSMLIENAGEIIPTMAKIVGGQTFTPYLAGYLPELLKRLKPSSTVAEKSFAIGALAETLEACGEASVPFVQHIYPLFMAGLKEQDEEVRSNSVFAVGALALAAGSAMKMHFPEILGQLSNLLQRESDRRVVDNICGAVCRLILSDASAVPIDQVFPAIIQCLPLVEDLEENKTVFTCIKHLYSAGHQQVINQLPQIMCVIAHVLSSADEAEDITEEVRVLMAQLVQSTSQQYPQHLHTAVTTLTPELASHLQSCITST